MIDLKRRRMMQAAAGGFALGPFTRLASASELAPAKLTDIDHIVVLMKENRSFDHYFGTLRGVRGFDDPTAIILPGGRSVFHQPDTIREDGFLLPFRLDTSRTRAQRMRSLDHSWAGLHAAWNQGAMDNWVASRRRFNVPSAPLTMGYFTRDDIPFYHALADAFTVCDGYYASMLGPTHPNRSFLWTGTIDPDGHDGGPAIDNRGQRYTWETYPERLEQAGVSWRIYHDADDFGCNQCKFFAQYQDASPRSALFENAMRNRPTSELIEDIRRGNLPQVTWIVPKASESEHPDYMPVVGEDYTQRILEALWANPVVWAKTVFILNYDENDGQFDHVAPPVPPPGTPGEFVRGLPIGLGFRVPCLLISPFSRGGFVCGDTFDHTSTLRLMETRFGVEVPNLSAWRRSTVGDLTTALGLGLPPDFSIPQFATIQARRDSVERDLTTLPDPEAPINQVLPRQETGGRPRRQGSTA